MPERQSSPGEVTARPETERTESNGQQDSPRGDAASVTGTDRAADDATVEQQVAAAPEAVEPAPAAPGDSGPAAAGPAVDGAAVSTAASTDTDQPGRATAAAPSGSGPSGSAPTGSVPSGSAPAGGSSTPQAAAGSAPAQPGRSTGSSEPPAAAAPRPRPHPRPEQDGPAGDESPTVATAVPGAPAPGAPASGTAGAAAAGSSAPPSAGAAPAPRPDAAGGDPSDDPTITVPRSGAANASGGNGSGTTAPGTTAPGSSTTGAAAGPTADDEPTVTVPAGTVKPARTEPPTWFTTSWDSDATQVIPRSAAAGAASPAAATPAPAAVEQPTERIPLAAAAAAPPPAPPAEPDVPVDGGDEPPRRSRRKVPLFVVGGVVAVLALLYGGDLAISSGSVPRGVTVAGVEVGGLSLADAEQQLRGAIEPRSTSPVAVTVGEATSEIDPRTAGLAVDWTGTLDRAGDQPLNPVTRVTSFFTQREIGVATTVDRPALDSTLAELAPIVSREPTEGSVRFEGVSPVPVDPVPGQELDLPGAAEVLQRDWASGGTVALPLAVLPPTTTREDVTAAIDGVARPAVSAPVTVAGEGGTQGTIAPQVIAASLSFRADPAGGLVPQINQQAVTDALKPQLAASERPGRDAALDFATGAPVVVPSQDGRGVDYEKTLSGLLPVLTGTGPRQLTAVYADQPAELTTEDLNALGITGVIGEFSTGGFAADSGRNIKRAAEQINGTILQPGETFSLNALTNPRDAAHGYVEAGIISDGHAARGIGGGVSQVATTTYNAAYFAGMTNVEHKEHSFYISRYPAGREATVFDDIIDLKFRNDNPTGVMIQTVWTPGQLTVRIYGTKRYEVTSTPGPRTNPTSPNTITIPAGQSCAPSQGAPGFTVTDTRTLREISTGVVRNETRTVKYNPSPVVICG